MNPPHPNPSGDGVRKLRSPPGKGNKPVALADITNTGKPNAARSITAQDLVKVSFVTLAPTIQLPYRGYSCHTSLITFFIGQSIR